jgi:hypothetical protein
MRELLSVMICFVLCVTMAAAQDSVLVVGTTVSAIDGSALPYSTFSIDHGARRFANGDGSFSFRAKAGVAYRINVKQLGFSPLDTTITFGRVSTVRVTFGLRGIAYRLAAVRTEVRHPCSAEIRGTELSAVLE